MSIILIMLFCSISISSMALQAIASANTKKIGRTLSLGSGFCRHYCYHGYTSRSLQVLNLSDEVDVVKFKS